MSLSKLVERLEAATAEEQRQMLEAAFRAVHGEKPERVRGGSDELTAWLRGYNPFFAMLEAKAYESAAMALVPEGWTWVVDAVGRASCFMPNEPKPWPRAGGLAATPAFALCAAALRARAASVDTHRDGGDVKQAPAPLSGAVASAMPTADAQPSPDSSNA